MPEGLSIVICCYNSSKLLPQTLKYISLQKVPEGIPWEVIVVDNFSTDNTSQVAENLWKEYNCKVPFQILKQPIQGLTAARRMGVENSKFEYILFCDDDNWLDEDYVRIGFQVMESNEKIAALGGDSEAVFEIEPPLWFSQWEKNYSVGKQESKTGDITWKSGVVWGAGMIVRKTALKKLFSEGFHSLLIDRKGNKLTSGGDTELCYALRLAGWKIWYDSHLKLKHYLSTNKLNWIYLRKLHRGFGAQKVDFDPYIKAFDPEPKGFNEILKQKWQYQTLKLILKIRGYGFKKLLSFKKNSEADSDILRIEKSIGRLHELLKIRGEYNKRINLIKNASWRKIYILDNSV